MKTSTWACFTTSLEKKSADLSLYVVVDDGGDQEDTFFDQSISITSLVKESVEFHGNNPDVVVKIKKSLFDALGFIDSLPE